MANQLTMADIDRILTLHTTQHSNREIAALLGLSRETVGKYVARAKAQNQPNAPTGTEGGEASHSVEFQNQPNAPTGSVDASTPGPSSECEPFREQILAKVEQGLQAVRIHQDFVEEYGDSAPSYYSVRRFVSRVKKKTPLPFRRLETEPAEEAQVDFGTGALVRMADGKTRRPWVFRIVLCYSRKAYSEVVWHQTTEAFVQCLENAFRYFGGVPKRLVIDNLKAAVAQADWYDPEVHPKLQSFARYYATVILPTKPYTPRHKGKIENSIKYVKQNALKGRTFPSLAELGSAGGRPAHSRHHQTASRQVIRAGGTTSTIALAGRAIPVLPRGAARGPSRWLRGSRQGVLFRAAGIRGTSTMGALGCALGSTVQRSLGTVDRPCQD
jgi:transposase